MPTEQEIRQALKKVIDPEIGLSVEDLGMIREVLIEDDSVKVKMVLTAPMCPLASYLTEAVRSAVEGVEGVSKAEVILLDEPWNPAWVKIKPK